MKWLHENNVNHIAQATVRAIRVAKQEHDDVQFVYNNIPVVVNEHTVPKNITPRYEAAAKKGDYRLIDGRAGDAKTSVFRVAVASLATLLFLP